jgi:hypothetical protein
MSDYWAQDVETLIKDTLHNELELSDYLNDRIWIGELVSISNPEFPMILFHYDSSPGIRDQDFQVYTGRVRLWVWVPSGDSQLWWAFSKVKTLLNRLKFIYNSVKVEFRVREPVRGYDPELNAESLVSYIDFTAIE